MDQIVKINQSKQTRTGLFVSGVVELVLAYIVGSLAIDTGSYWYYLFTLIFIVGAIHSFAKAHKHYVRK